MIEANFKGNDGLRKGACVCVCVCVFVCLMYEFNLTTDTPNQ